MKRRTIIAVILSVLLFAQAGKALEARFYPQNPLYLNQANAEHGTYDVIAHMLLIKNDSSEKIVIEKVDYQYFADDRLLEEKHVTAKDLIASTNDLLQMNQQGMQVMTNVVLPPEILGKDGKLGSSEAIAPGEALTSQNVYATLQGIPMRLLVTVSGKNAAGKPVKASAVTKIVRYESPNHYICPLKGVWYMQSIPNVTSHHRWLSETEFAIDFLKVDGNGSLKKTDGKTAADYYAFGQPVFAAADGVVVKAINDATQDWDSWIQRKGESDQDFDKRSSQTHLEAMKKDLYRAVTGNLVVIQHPGGEYSAYAHLKKGSLKVKVGDRVKQGQQIAEVGDTGDYFMAHLHFQISDRPDVLHGRSLPLEFTDLSKGRELGHFSK